MPISQNLRFVADAPLPVGFDHPVGNGLMRRLRDALITAGWTVGEVENWRDSGWSALCQRGAGRLEIVLANIQNRDWMIQIAAAQNPGCLGKLLGRLPSATPADVQDLAAAVHNALAAAGLLGDPHWRWDGFPDDKNSTAEPQPVN